MEEFLEILEKYRTEVFNFNVFVGIVAAIGVLILEIVWMRKRTNTNKQIAKAIKKGHVVDATRLKTWNDDITGTNVDSWVYATYSYEVDGKSYQYKYMDRANAPIKLKLYYLDNPHKAFSEKQKKKNIFSLLFYIIPIAVAVIVINLLGGI